MDLSRLRANWLSWVKFSARKLAISCGLTPSLRDRILQPIRRRPTMAAVIYARFSTDRQAETSIEDQARICRARAEALQLDVTRLV